MRINGAHCGLEAIVLGIVTNIGGFLFGYDTVRAFFTASDTTDMLLSLTL